MNQSPEKVIEQLRAENNALKVRCFDIGLVNEQLQQALNNITGASGLTGNHSIDDLTRHVYLLAHPEERERLEQMQDPAPVPDPAPKQLKRLAK